MGFIQVFGMDKCGFPAVAMYRNRILCFPVWFTGTIFRQEGISLRKEGYMSQHLQLLAPKMFDSKN